MLLLEMLQVLDGEGHGVLLWRLLIA